MAALPEPHDSWVLPHAAVSPEPATGLSPARSTDQGLDLQLDWSAHDAYGAGDAYAAVPATGGGFGKAAALCIGSRQCQKARGEPGDPGLMCPSYRITRQDLHSTRGRAAALRAALDGDLGPQPFGGALDAAMDLCVACKGCKRECPNGVDMAALRAETLAQRWRHRPMPWRTRLFADLPQWLPRLARWRTPLAWAQRLPGARALLQRTLGIAAARSLPLPAARSFARRWDGPVAGPAPAPTASARPVAAADPARAAAAARPNSEPTPEPKPGREVVLLVDCFANHLEPEVAEAALAVLHAAGVGVHPLVARPGQPLCCGRTAYSAGDVAAARAHAQTLLDALAPHLAAGRAVVGLEPSCLSMLRDEWQQLGLPAQQVQPLVKQAWMLEELLARELDARRLQVDWQPLQAQVLVHGHCHQKAFGTLKALRKLLAAVPGLQAQWVEGSCCGMAGSFGYEAEHHAASLAMAELALLPAVRAAPPQTLVLASGTSCRHQIRDGAGRTGLHLAQLLAQALPAAARGR